MQTIGLAMIVKDEPIDRLAMLIDFMKPVVTEVLISDTGSLDIDRDEPLYNSWGGVRVWRHEWTNDFSAARNSALDFLTTDWVLHLDADELPSMGMLDHLRWVRDGSEVDRNTLGYLYFTLNYWGGERGISVEAHWHCRLFRNGRGRWYKPLHEQVMLDGKSESQARGTITLPKAPRDAYLIHSKPREKLDSSAVLYKEIERNA